MIEHLDFKGTAVASRTASLGHIQFSDSYLPAFTFPVLCEDFLQKGPTHPMKQKWQLRPQHGCGCETQWNGTVREGSAPAGRRFRFCGFRATWGLLTCWRVKSVVLDVAYYFLRVSASTRISVFEYLYVCWWPPATSKTSPSQHWLHISVFPFLFPRQSPSQRTGELVFELGSAAVHFCSSHSCVHPSSSSTIPTLMKC